MNRRGNRRGECDARPRGSGNVRDSYAGARRGGSNYPDDRRPNRFEEEYEGRLSPENKARRVERPNPQQSRSHRPESGSSKPDAIYYGERQRNYEHKEYRGGSNNTQYRGDSRGGYSGRGGRGEYSNVGQSANYRRETRPMRGQNRDGGGGGRDYSGRKTEAIVPAGTMGFLRSNISEVIVSQDKKVYRHRVEISYKDPSKLTPTLRRLILTRTLAESGFRGYYPYDGVSIMVAEEPINITDVFEGRPLGLRADGEITIYPTGEPLLLSDINNDKARGKSAELVNVFQMIVDEASRLKAPFISAGAYAHRGDQWVRPWGHPRFDHCPVTLNVCHKNALGMICVDGRPRLAMTTDVVGRLRLEETTVDKLADAMGIDLDVRSRRNNNSWRLLALLKGLRVSTKHLGYDRRIHIVDIKDETAISSTLDFNGKTISLAQYYKRNYDIDLQRPYLRILVDTKGGLYPPEILHLESQAWSNKLKAQWQAEVPKLMAMPSHQREAYLRKALHDAFGGNPVLEYFGIEVNEETVTPMSQVLRAPVVRYANRDISVVNGAWNLTGTQMLSPAERGRCAFVNLTTEYRRPDVLNFYQALSRACSGYGLELSPLDESTYYERTDWPDALKRLRQLHLDLVFVLISRESEEEYGYIKAHGDPELPTQVIVAANTPFFGKGANRPEQHLGNLALKINTKLGGTCHGIASGKTPFNYLMQTGETVIMGADICHGGKTTVEGCQLALPSYAALVVTVDKECSQQAYSLRAQPGGPDVMQYMVEQVTEVLNRRDKLLNQRNWPKQVIYLRDGFSDSSIDEIRDEAEKIKRAYKVTGQSFTPRVLAIAVRKRQMTRFFAADDLSHKNNVMPGIVVMDDLTLPSPYPNFYMISHAGIKGTTVPTRYVVVYDDFQKTMPQLQSLDRRGLSEKYSEFCYQMCALFPRCTRVVSYPGPVYSSHYLAERASKLADQRKESLYYYPERGKSPQEILDRKLCDMIKTMNRTFGELPLGLAWL